MMMSKVAGVDNAGGDDDDDSDGNVDGELGGRGG